LREPYSLTTPMRFSLYAFLWKDDYFLYTSTDHFSYMLCIYHTAFYSFCLSGPSYNSTSNRIYNGGTVIAYQALSSKLRHEEELHERKNNVFDYQNIDES